MRYDLYSMTYGEDAIMNIHVELRMGEEDNRLTVWTTCDLFEPAASEPSTDLRKTLDRLSDSHAPLRLYTPPGDIPWAITTFLSRTDPKTFIRTLLDMGQCNKVPDAPTNLDHVDGIVNDVEVGTRKAAHKLMSLASLKTPDAHTGRTPMILTLFRTMRTPMTPRDMIVFWAGSAIKYPLEDLLSLSLTTNDLVLIKLTIGQLVEDPIKVSWKPPA